MSENIKNWWNKLSLEEKFYNVIPWLKEKGINCTEKHPDSLSNQEIEEIYMFNLKNK